MYTISEAAIPTIKGDMANVIDAADTFLGLQAQMLNTIIEAARTSDIPLKATQRVYGEVLDAMMRTFDARGLTGKSLTTMTAIGRQSQYKEMMDGCPGGLPDTQGAVREQIEV